jgi:hypothetical protein
MSKDILGKHRKPSRVDEAFNYKRQVGSAPTSLVPSQLCQREVVASVICPLSSWSRVLSKPNGLFLPRPAPSDG